MKKDQMKELQKLCGSNSILIINNKGIYRLFVPFKATCIEQIDTYSIGDTVTVIAVKMSANYKLVYIIKNKAFYHHYFVILTTPTTIQTTYN